MSRDVIDFNEKVCQTALELAEARGANEEVLQGLNTMWEFTDEALKDADTMEKFADLLTGGTEARSRVADILARMQDQSFRLITNAAGEITGWKTAPDGKVIYPWQEFLGVRVQHTGDIRLELTDRNRTTFKETALPSVRMVVTYYNSVSASRKYVYSLWVTAYLTVLAQNILQYNIHTSVPFMDEEG